MAKLFILCGLTFSGKTSLAQRIAEYLPVTIISFDEIYEELRQETGGNLSPQPEVWDQVKRIALLSLSENLQEGRNVIWDSTNPLKKHREELIEIGDRFGAQSIVVHVNTPLDEIRRRKERNKFTNERSDRGLEEFEQRLRIWENPLEGEHAIQITSEADILTFINEIDVNTRRSKER